MEARGEGEAVTQTSASSRRQIEAQRARQRRDDEVEEAIIHIIMRNPEGRRWMWNQLAFCRAFHVDANTDPGQMAFEKGLRNYGMKLFTAVGRFAPAEYLTMTREMSMVAAKEQHDGGSANDADDADAA